MFIWWEGLCTSILCYAAHSHPLKPRNWLLILLAITWILLQRAKQYKKPRVNKKKKQGHERKKENIHFYGLKTNSS